MFLKKTQHVFHCVRKKKEFFFCYHYYAGLIDAWRWSRFINNWKGNTKVKLKTVCDFFFWTFYPALWTFWTWEKEFLQNFSRLYWCHGCSSPPPFCFLFLLSFAIRTFTTKTKTNRNKHNQRKKKKVFVLLLLWKTRFCPVFDFFCPKFLISGRFLFFYDNESLVV